MKANQLNTFTQTINAIVFIKHDLKEWSESLNNLKHKLMQSKLGTDREIY